MSVNEVMFYPVFVLEEISKNFRLVLGLLHNLHLSVCHVVRTRLKPRTHAPETPVSMPDSVACVIPSGIKFLPAPVSGVE